MSTPTWPTPGGPPFIEVIATNTFGHEGIGEIEVETIRVGDKFVTGIVGLPGMSGTFGLAQTEDGALRCHAFAIDLVKSAFRDLAKVSGA